MIYIETSALLGWLVNETHHDKIVRALQSASVVITSSLSLLEAKRALIRLKNDGVLTASQAGRLKGTLLRASDAWVLFDISPEILLHSANEFQIEPVRSLDAIHLATILIALQAYPDLKVLTTDPRIIKNLSPLGLDLISLE